MTPRLELTGITKRYPGVLAADSVDLRVMPGEIHALLGENGAGKSTLMKVLFGLVRADAGTTRIDGEAQVIANPNTARRLGIAMVFQHFSLFEALTVAENIALGLNDGRSVHRLAKEIRAVGERYGLRLDPRAPVHHLSVGERQRVEITRCLLQEPRLLIMDEPTSVLSPNEIEPLFATLRQIADAGCAILFISHKLEEVRVLCRAATILRAGRVVARVDPQAETAASLAAKMVGADVVEPAATRRAPGPVRLRVEGLTTTLPEVFAVNLHAISFAVRAGEVLGIAGVAGNGQAVLQQALSGELLTAPATIQLDDMAIGGVDARARRRLGLAVVPEERLGRGAVPSFDLLANTVLTGYDRHRLSVAGWLRRRRARRHARAIIEANDVRTPGVEHEARALSGGNLQKFIVGREIALKPNVLIAAQPTWGVDARAAAAIHTALLDLARQGAALVLISQDLDELLALCDAVVVLHDGRLSAPQPPERLSREAIGLLMGGARTSEGQRDAA